MNISKKISFKLIENIEISILEWAQVRRYRIALFIFVVLLLILLSHVPYINLFFNSYLVILTSVLLAPFVLDIDAKPFFITSICLLVLTFVMWFVDRDGAEAITEYIFIILLSGVLKTLFSS